MVASIRNLLQWMELMALRLIKVREECWFLIMHTVIEMKEEVKAMIGQCLVQMKKMKSITWLCRGCSKLSKKKACSKTIIRMLLKARIKERWINRLLQRFSCRTTLIPGGSPRGETSYQSISVKTWSSWRKTWSSKEEETSAWRSGWKSSRASRKVAVNCNKPLRSKGVSWDSLRN